MSLAVRPEPVHHVGVAPQEAVARIEVDSLQKAFRRRGGAEVRAVDGVSLSVRSGEIVVLLGPSGCGKTTLLRCVAGLETPSAGEIRINGRTVFSGSKRICVPAEERQVAMMFQSYAVWPHMSVFENVAYPLRARKLVRRSAIRERVMETLEKVHIVGLSEQYPSNLSGGQQQRVALARCLVVDPDVVLFDEPLSNVDARVRQHLRTELTRMQRALGFSALYVTHDQHEAMQIADRLAVLRSGALEQIGTPTDLYRSPVSTYVADFLGGANCLRGTVTSVRASDVVVATEIGSVTVRRRASDAALTTGAEVDVVIRAEDITVAAMSAEAPVSGRLVASSFVGTHVEHIVEVGGRLLDIWDGGRAILDAGQAVSLVLEPERAVVLPRDPEITQATNDA